MYGIATKSKLFIVYIRDRKNRNVEHCTRYWMWLCKLTEGHREEFLEVYTDVFSCHMCIRMFACSGCRIGNRISIRCCEMEPRGDRVHT